MTLKRLDMYVGVSDMERATAFYRGLFRAEPVTRTENHTGFDLNGARFGLFRQDAYGSEHPLVRGNSTIANILVDDIDAEFERIRALKPRHMTDAIVTTGQVRLFLFADPDGNVIEGYADQGRDSIARAPTEPGAVHNAGSS